MKHNLRPLPQPTYVSTASLKINAELFGAGAHLQNDTRREAIAAGIGRFGVFPLVIDRTSKVVVGTERAAVLNTLGLRKVPVYFLDNISAELAAIFTIMAPNIDLDEPSILGSPTSLFQQNFDFLATFRGASK